MENRIILASIFVIFDKSDKVLCVVDGFKEADEFLNRRASELKAMSEKEQSPILERLKVARLNMGSKELCSLISGNAKLSGKDGIEVVILDGNWFMNVKPMDFAHTIPSVAVKGIDAE